MSFSRLGLLVTKTIDYDRNVLILFLDDLFVESNIKVLLGLSEKQGQALTAGIMGQINKPIRFEIFFEESEQGARTLRER